MALPSIRIIMPIKLPDLNATNCDCIIACGEIKTSDRELVSWMKKGGGSIADLDKDGNTYITVGLGESSGKHFHVDISKEVFSPKKKAQRVRRTEIGKIQQKFDRLIGKEVLVDLRGYFPVKTKDLPETGIIKSLFFRTQIGDVALKIKGSRLAIEGAPVTEITWQSIDDGKIIGIVIEAENVKTKVDEDYLTNALAILENALKVFVLGK